jgi:hypothetical protein
VGSRPFGTRDGLDLGALIRPLELHRNFYGASNLPTQLIGEASILLKQALEAPLAHASSLRYQQYLIYYSRTPLGKGDTRKSIVEEGVPHFFDGKENPSETRQCMRGI